ncbi:MAG: cytochrome c [Methyloversatilis sp.]|uniref:c-type cytochrome n=1 Tax=Methyloversatilis sp. TaxID=2569862 RepID=UPI0027326B19|nr:cytochrome c [Methyloversatilis sp.]MDP3871178.1 cytochrome c [Methyloversatilis sp.]
MKRAALILPLLALLAALVWWTTGRDAGPDTPAIANASRVAAPSTELVARGEYLARAGNCMACHSARGGTPWAGGRAINTTFGTFYTTNLTPDPDTGLGRWTSDEFWRALHEGRSRDGRLLYPAFPYTSYTHVTREDSDALWAYLQTLPATRQASRPHVLRFPYDSQTALAAWRALYFKPAVFQADASQSADWNRGAYLVQGLGHCSACHAPRNALGASEDADKLAGGLMAGQNWYAPSLGSPHEAGVQGWKRDDVIALLRDGITHDASVAGPMAEVVYGSTQYLSAGDLDAMATYLQALPATSSAAATGRAVALDDAQRARAALLYADHCANCHGEQGEGSGRIYPALDGNRAVTLDPPANPLRIVLGGGFAPATQGNPRPFGMPPFAASLSDEDIALVVSHIRSSWSNTASPVSVIDVQRYRGNLR